MNNNLSKRIVTSLLLLILLLISLLINKYFWLILLLVVSIILFNEFNNLIKKAYKKDKKLVNLISIISIIYLILFIYTAYNQYTNFRDLVLILSICIFSDTGGFIVGKLIGGKKLTIISPNKTIAGSLGSFLFSLFPLIILLIIYKIPTIKALNFYSDLTILIFISLLLSFVCQSGDLFISYFKRKAKVKDTGSILPGHGGLLDRIDGAIFVIPTAFIVDKILF
jgi:phosphatidate cytidylyltransferase